MYWINSGYKYRISDRGIHFFDFSIGVPVLCTNIIFAYIPNVNVRNIYFIPLFWEYDFGILNYLDLEKGLRRYFGKKYYQYSGIGYIL